MKLEPEHFDLLGIVVFPFIFACGLYMLLTATVPNIWTLWALIVIGVGGIIIDGSIVYLYFIRKKK